MTSLVLAALVALSSPAESDPTLEAELAIAYSCTTTDAEYPAEFELELVRAAVITTASGDLFDGSYSNRVITEDTRLKGYQELRIDAAGTRGTVELFLIADESHAFGHGLVTVDGAAGPTTILLGCQALDD